MKRILVVEDSNITRQVYRNWLEAHDYQVIEATDGFEAIECVQWASPDLILMDLALPRMNGVSAIEQIRQLRGGKGIPIIAVTGYKEALQEEALLAGCNKVLSKPVEYPFLLLLLAQHLFEIL